MTEFQITLFKKREGVLSKRISACPDTGVPISDGSACMMGSGEAKTVSIAGLDDLATCISEMPPSTALALGVPREERDGVQKVVTAANASTAPASVMTRTMRDMHFKDGSPAFMLIDVDFKGAPSAITAEAKERGLMDILCDVAPALADAGKVVRGSTSSHLRNEETGEDFAGGGGLHIYVPVANGADMQRALGVLAKRLWLAGFGWIMVSQAGSQLVRTLADVTVASPERLVFEGAPIVDKPLIQDANKRAAEVHAGGILDTSSALPDLNAGEAIKYDRLVAGAKAATAVEAAEVRAGHERGMVADLVATGMPLEVAQDRIASRHKLFLPPEAVLQMDDGTEVPVSEVLADVESFDGATMADPLEGLDYGRCKAKLLPEPDDEGYRVIHTIAHGSGDLFRLQPGWGHVERIIRDTPKEHVLKAYAAAVRQSVLDPGGKDRAKRLVMQVHSFPATPVKEAIKADTAAVEAMRKRAHVERINAEARLDPRIPHPIPRAGAEFVPQFEEIDAVLAGIDAPHPPLRDARGLMACVQKRPVPETIQLRTKAEIDAGVAEKEAIALSIRPTVNGTEPCVELERHIRWFQVNEAGEEISRHVPIVWATTFAKWEGSKCPTVVGTSVMPLVMRGQNMIAPVGLHRGTKHYFDIDSEIVDLLPKGPTSLKQAKAAYKWLCEEMLCDVTTDADGMAVSIALMLTLIEAPLLDAKPGLIITASRRAGGKTTLALMLVLAVLGSRPPATPWDPNAEERRKQIMAALWAGFPTLVYDNFQSGTSIADNTVNAILTSGRVSDRVLGKSEVVEVLATIMPIFTGNNITARGDLASRILSVEIEVLRSDPENRDFKHPDPFGWIMQNRSKILSALFTILMVERPGAATYGTRFKKWMEMVGEPLAMITGIDFASKFSEGEAEDDVEKSARVLLMQALIDTFDISVPFISADVRDKMIMPFYEREPFPPPRDNFGNGGTADPQYVAELALYRQLHDKAEGFKTALETVAGGARFSEHKPPGTIMIGRKLQTIVKTPVDLGDETVRLVGQKDRTRVTTYTVEKIVRRSDAE